MFGPSVVRPRLLLIISALLLGSTAFGLPIKPKIEDIIKEAKKPVVNYPPARAGWNGPEGKSPVAMPNPTYDRLRLSMSPEAVRMQLFHAATPDWRALLGLAGLIVIWRYRRRHPQAQQLERPLRPEMVPIPIAGNPVTRDKQAA